MLLCPGAGQTCPARAAGTAVRQGSSSSSINSATRQGRVEVGGRVLRRAAALLRAWPSMRRGAQASHLVHPQHGCSGLWSAEPLHSTATATTATVGFKHRSHVIKPVPSDEGCVCVCGVRTVVGAMLGFVRVVWVVHVHTTPRMGEHVTHVMRRFWPRLVSRHASLAAKLRPQTLPQVAAMITHTAAQVQH